MLDPFFSSRAAAAVSVRAYRNLMRFLVGLLHLPDRLPFAYHEPRSAVVDRAPRHGRRRRQDTLVASVRGSRRRCNAECRPPSVLGLCTGHSASDANTLFVIGACSAGILARDWRDRTQVEKLCRQGSIREFAVSASEANIQRTLGRKHDPPVERNGKPPVPPTCGQSGNFSGGSPGMRAPEWAAQRQGRLPATQHISRRSWPQLPL